MDFGDSPEVCFLGRSNVGKSSLLNALLCRNIAYTSSKPGRTKLMNAFAVGGSEDNGKNRLVVLDMPGYGKGGRPQWGTQIMKYLEKRKQLRRTFLLIDAEHGVKTSDRQLLALIKDIAIPYQVILSKADKIVFPGSRTPGPEALEARLSELRRTMESVKEAVQPNRRMTEVQLEKSLLAVLKNGLKEREWGLMLSDLLCYGQLGWNIDQRSTWLNQWKLYLMRRYLVLGGERAVVKSSPFSTKGSPPVSCGRYRG